MKYPVTLGGLLTLAFLALQPSGASTEVCDHYASGAFMCYDSITFVPTRYCYYDEAGNQECIY